MDEPLIYGHTMTHNAKTWVEYPELRDHAIELQDKVMQHKMEDEGYEPIGETAVLELIYFNIIDHGEDKDGEPIIEFQTVETPEDATYVRRTIEVQARKVNG